MVEWSEPARDDLRAIYEYIALDSPFYAKNTVRNIVERAAKVSDTPEIGRIVPELGEEKIREVFIFSYRIIYQIFPEKVTVLTVVHGYRAVMCSFCFSRKIAYCAETAQHQFFDSQNGNLKEGQGTIYL